MTCDANSSIARRGVLLALSAPSGAGKTTLARRLLASDPAITLSVSVTTRSRRPNEIDGRDYHFIDVAAFTARRDAGELLEWAQVYDHFYATPRAPVADALASGRDMLLDIDWQGAAQVRAALSNDFVSVFILPPSAAALEARLRGRAQDSEETVAKRMRAAAADIGHWNDYDYAVVNDDLDASLAEIRAILTAERLRRDRRTGLSAFTRDLQAGL